LLQLVEAVRDRVALENAAGTGRAGTVALDDCHRRVVGQLPAQFQFGLEVEDLAIEQLALLIDGIDRRMGSPISRRWSCLLLLALVRGAKGKT
jgi:hypothetical protein